MSRREDRRRWVALSMAAGLAVLSGTASVRAQVSGTWNVATGGNWSSAGNWTGGVPDAGGTATLGSPPATGPITVTLDSGRSLSGLTFNGTNPYSIVGTSSLTLVSPRTITANAGTHTIGVPLAGTAGLTKAGAGTLVLTSSTATLTGNTAVNAGVLRIGNSNAIGPAGADNQLGMAFGGVAELSSGVSLGSRNVAFATSAASVLNGALRSLAGATSSSGTWFLLAGSSVGVDAGSTLTHTGDLIDNSAGTATGLTKAGPGTLVVRRFGGTSVPSGGGTVQQPLNSLTVSDGTARVAPATSGPDSNASRVKGLAIASGATLDLTDGALVYDYSGASPITTLRGYLASGQLTTTAAGPTNARLGYAETSALTGFTGTFAGQLGLDATTLVVRRTLAGDANLDGTVNFADLLTLAQGYGSVGTWTSGDFSYDGTVNFADLLLLAQAYGQTFAGEAAGSTSWALAQSAVVPEPIEPLTIGGLVGLALRRRRMA